MAILKSLDVLGTKQMGVLLLKGDEGTLADAAPLALAGRTAVFFDAQSVTARRAVHGKVLRGGATNVADPAAVHGGLLGNASASEDLTHSDGAASARSRRSHAGYPSKSILALLVRARQQSPFFGHRLTQGTFGPAVRWVQGSRRGKCVAQAGSLVRLGRRGPRVTRWGRLEPGFWGGRAGTFRG